MLPYLPYARTEALTEEASLQSQFLVSFAKNADQLVDSRLLTEGTGPANAAAAGRARFEALLRAAELSFSVNIEHGGSLLRRAVDTVAQQFFRPKDSKDREGRGGDGDQYEGDKSNVVDPPSRAKVALALALARPDAQVTLASDRLIAQSAETQDRPPLQISSPWSHVSTALFARGSCLMAAALATKGDRLDNSLSALTERKEGRDEENPESLFRRRTGHLLSATDVADVLPMFGVERLKGGSWIFDRTPGTQGIDGLIALHLRERARLSLLAGATTRSVIVRGVPLIDLTLLGVHVALIRRNLILDESAAERIHAAGLWDGFDFYQSIAESLPS